MSVCIIMALIPPTHQLVLIQKHLENSGLIRTISTFMLNLRSVSSVLCWGYRIFPIVDPDP